MGYNAVTREPGQYSKRTNEYWWSEISESSISSLYATSQASLSSVSSDSGISTITGGGSNTLTGGIATATMTTTFISDGSTIVSTFTTATSLSSSPTSGPGQSQPYPDTISTSSTLSMSSSSFSPAATQFQVGASEEAVCAGQGLDTQAIGVLSTLIFSAAIGFIIWVSCLIRRGHNTCPFPRRAAVVPSCFILTLVLNMSFSLYRPYLHYLDLALEPCMDVGNGSSALG
jgi:hypothetical protein